MLTDTCESFHFLWANIPLFLRCCCSHRIMANIWSAWRICCRNTRLWKPTLPFRPTGSETSTATRRSLLWMWRVRRPVLALSSWIPFVLHNLSCDCSSINKKLPCSFWSGYKPCDPQVIQDRVTHMDFCYQELSQLAAERRARLEESRRLWKFFWEMAEEVHNHSW